MPAFHLLALLGIIILWFLLAFVFKPVGRFTSKLFGDAIDIMKGKEAE